MRDDFVIFIILGVLILFAVFSSKNNTATQTATSTPILREQVFSPDGYPANNYSESPEVDIQEQIYSIQDKSQELAQTIAKERALKEQSVFFGQIEISSVHGASSTDSNQEYVRLHASENNKQAVDITGWKLTNTTGKSITIGTAIEKYASAEYRLNTASRIRLAPGADAIITTGGSPLIYSFRINKCMGYLQRDIDFNPSIIERCPTPQSEGFYLPPTSVENDECMDFVDNMASCSTPFRNDYDNLSKVCRNYLSKTFSYSGCLAKHSGDLDFYDNDWRFFAGRNKSLWKDRREEIKLIDTVGKTVSAYRFSWY